MRADKYYHPYPYGLEFILVGLLGILGGVIFSGNSGQSEPQPTQSSSNNSADVASTSNEKKWDLIWKQEGGGCQNWANDRQNNGGAWFTCMGIVQRTWTQYVRQNPSLNLPDRVEVAYRQLGSTEFKKHAIVIYKKDYCKPVNCDSYKGPLPALLMAISANGGPGVARRHLANTSHIQNPKERAMAIAKAEHARYDRIAANNPSQRGFRKGGWQQNIDNRYDYINQF